MVCSSRMDNGLLPNSRLTRTDSMPDARSARKGGAFVIVDSEKILLSRAITQHLTDGQVLRNRLNWMVHDFTDRGIGTCPLVSYDHKHFYIIYSALDNNLKLYASHDPGQTWTGPTTIVAGNTPESNIAGSLSYEGGALTSPGTNVAIDGHGRLHVLYIDSNKQVPMYTSSHDHGAAKQIWAGDMMMVALFGAAHPAEKFFCPIRAGTD
jgi:hypothetical protein